MRRACVLIDAVNKTCVMTSRRNTELSHWRAVIGKVADYVKQTLSVCEKIDIQLIVVLMSGSEGRRLEEEPDIVRSPAGTGGDHTRILHNDVTRIDLGYSALDDLFELLVLGIKFQRILYPIHNVDSAAVVGAGRPSVRAHKLRIHRIKQADIILEVIGDRHSVLFRHAPCTDIRRYNNVLVSRRQFSLEAVGIDLCLKLCRHGIDGKAAPLVISLKEAEDSREGVESRHLNIEPVERGGAVLKQLAVLPDRHRNTHPGGILDGRRFQECVNSIRPISASDACRNCTPGRYCRASVRHGPHRALRLCEPACHMALESVGILFVTRLEIGVSDYLEDVMTVELPEPLLILIGSAVEVPIDLAVIVIGI